MRGREGVTVGMAAGLRAGEKAEGKKEKEQFHVFLIEDGEDKRSPEFPRVTLGSGVGLRF